MQDHQLNKDQKFRTWVEEQVAQMHQQRLAIDNMFQQIAALARLNKIKPEKLVETTQDIQANYAFLTACMKEETRLQEEAQAKAKEVADKFAINNNTNAKNEESASVPASV